MSHEELLRTTGRHSALFKGTSDETFAIAMKEGKVQDIAKGERIFVHGEPGDYVYVLLRGSVHSELDGLKVSKLSVGGIGGASSIISNQGRRSQTHIADVDSVIFKIDRKTFKRLLEREDFRDHIITHLGNKLRHKNVILSHMLIPEKSAKELKIAVFDTKPYDVTHLSKAFKGMKTKDGKEVKLCFLDTKLTADTVSLAAGSHAVCIFVNDTCDAAVIQQLKVYDCQMILLRCAGFNNVDLAEAAKLGIAVTRVPAYSPYAVAEHAMALLFTLNRRTHQAYNRVRDGNFTLKGLEGRDLHGLTCGVFGTGKIGRCFADIAHGLGMKLLFWDPYPKKELEKVYNAKYIKDKKEILSQCDVITIHLPLTSLTRHFINAEAIAALPPGAIILNTSRGPIVDSDALLQGLISGKLGGAGLDVYENEKEFFFEDCSGAPLDDEVLARLINMPNVVITSHQAFLTQNALTAISEMTKHNVEEFFNDGKRGKDLTNAVLPEKERRNNNNKKDTNTNKKSKL